MPFLIGANPNTTANTAYGNIKVKQLQIYNRAISEEEIPIVSEGKVANNEGLLRYVDFTNKSYENNEIIPEDAIESYFVWIPKYRYQLWDLGQYDSLTEIDTSKVHEIPVIFGDYNTSDNVSGECTTPMESGATGNCQIGDYMTHPAFLSIPSTGFWVGKFDTGTTLIEDYNVKNSNVIQIKPNIVLWRSIQVANAFYTSYDYQRNLDSHMMKNTEWGAVAYLSQSQYGSSMNVRSNNNSAYIAGYQADKEPTCGYSGTLEECTYACNDGTCNTAYPNSVLSSTTGNITGIFDLSGGAWSYVMAFLNNGNILVGYSGFEGYSLDEYVFGQRVPELKYYDLYVFSINDTGYYSRILGDATGEMGPFGKYSYTEINVTRTISSWY